MGTQHTPYEKLTQFIDKPLFNNLLQANKTFLLEKSPSLGFTVQEIHNVIIMATDLEMWRGPLLEDIAADTNRAAEVSAVITKSIRAPANARGKGTDTIQTNPPAEAQILSRPQKQRPGRKEEKRAVISLIANVWQQMKDQGPNYSQIPAAETDTRRVMYEPGTGKETGIIDREIDHTILGTCPVAGEKTRCCNLLTLDAVQRCGFNCTYCSIRSFYNSPQIVIPTNLSSCLNSLEINPDELYHMGTGQSSDSLLWGNRNGMLDSLLDFARGNPNVILEFKTKSDAAGPLLERDLPPNLLVTWSLNTETIITNEEHGTAPLERRLKAARSLADKSAAVGFHFHPMVYYQGWRDEYSNLFKRLQKLFDPEEIVTISFGAVTLIKPVIRQIRTRRIPTGILQMPMDEAAGKYSYPLPLKRELFSSAYQSFSPEWKRTVFFYLCMEDPELWKPVFGFRFPSNNAFEKAMKNSYKEKMESIQKKRNHI